MSKQIDVGGVKIGGGAPVTVQSMTNTATEDVAATLAQIGRLRDAGVDIVRVAVPTHEAAAAMSAITAASPVPIVADIHFSHKHALEAVKNGVAKVRINPGNIGGMDNVRAVAEACRERNVPIRIGVNSGSVHKAVIAKHGGVTPEALCDSALSHVQLLEECGFYDIAVSIKAASVAATIAACRRFAELRDYPLHVGMTHAGTLHMATIKSAAAIGALLCDGIGDTIRVSLNADPTEEVRLGLDILRALGLRRDRPEIIACPTCGRCRVDLISLAAQVEKRLEGCTAPLKIAVMGCAVNGPGEARECDVGIACGDGEGLIFRNGEIVKKVAADQLVDQLMEQIEILGATV